MAVFTMHVGGYNATAFGSADQLKLRNLVTYMVGLPSVSYTALGAIADVAPTSPEDNSTGLISVVTTVYADADIYSRLVVVIVAMTPAALLDQSFFSLLGPMFNLSGATVQFIGTPVWTQLSNQPPAVEQPAPFSVSAAIAIAGTSVSTITAAQQQAFASTLASALGKNTADVQIQDVFASRSVAGRRRVLADAAAVFAVSVSAASRDDAGGVVQALLTPLTMTKLATGIQAQFPGVTAADLSLELPPSVTSAAASAQAAAACAAALLTALLLLS